MRTHGLVILTASLLIASDAFKRSPAAEEAESLQGTWIAVAAERQGKKVEDQEVRQTKIKLVLKEDKYTLFHARAKPGEPPLQLHGLYQVTPTKKPKWIDLTVDPKTTAKGIYELEGDTLRICYGENRPVAFKTEPGSDQRLFVFKREKP